MAMTKLLSGNEKPDPRRDPEILPGYAEAKHALEKT